MRYVFTYFSSGPTAHAQLLQAFREASAAERTAVKLKNRATGAAHGPDALAVAPPVATGATLIFDVPLPGVGAPLPESGARLTSLDALRRAKASDE